jgi:tetratricopeptide (TPR) repeat protein
MSELPPQPPTGSHNGSGTPGGPDPAAISRLTESMRNPATFTNPEQMEAVVQEVLQLAEAHSEANPSPDAPLHSAFHNQLESLDWAGAAETKRRIVENAAARSDHCQVYHHERQRSELLRLLGRTEEAMSAAREATAAARRIGEVGSLIARGLESEALTHLSIQAPAVALPLVNEALSVLENHPCTIQMRANLQILHARCLLGLGNLSACEHCLKEAWNSLSRVGFSELLAGVQISFANWHTTQARLHSARGEKSMATASQRSAVRHHRQAQDADLSNPFRAGPGLASALRGLARCLEAEGKLEESDQLEAEWMALVRSLRLERLPEDP